MSDAEVALGCANVLIQAMGKKGVSYLGEWNTLMLYLEKRVREEV